MIVPASDTTAVPPAETNGWYPKPLVDATDIITPPTGIPAVLMSLATELAAPVQVIVVPDPTVSNSKLPFDPGAWRTPFISIKALLVAIPVFCALSTVSAYCLFLPLKSDVKSSYKWLLT